MSTIKQNTDNNPVQHIGREHHVRRNVLLSLAAIVGLLGIGVFYWQAGKEGAAAAVELSQFRKLMYNRCGDEQFAGMLDPKLAGLYADSSRMRSAVMKQSHLLQSGETSCGDVAKALRSADYPIR